MQKQTHLMFGAEPSTSKEPSAGRAFSLFRNASDGKDELADSSDSDDDEPRPAISVAPNFPEFPSSEIKFKAAVVEKCLTRGVKDSKTKLSKEALVMMEWAMRTMVLETLCRCASQAQGENQHVVDVSHLEKILPQLTSILSKLSKK